MKKNLFIVCTLFLHAVLVHGQTLRWSSQGDFQTADPHSQNELLTNSINGQVYETLLRRDKQLQLEPGLATEWIQLSSTLWRLKLRDGVKFHDGTPFTADDVVFSVNRAKDVASGVRSYANPIGIPRKINDFTVEFEQPQFNPIFLEHLSLIFMMSKSWSEKHNVQKPLDYKAKEEKFSGVHANGTGPFLLVSRRPDIRSVFRRNADWWGSFDGNIQQVIYLPIKSDATRSAALISGDLDFVLDPVPQDVARLRASPNKVIDGFENRIIFIGLDQNRDELSYSNIKGKNPFKDLRVRRAMYQAIDVESLRTKIMRNQSISTGSITPSPYGSFNDPTVEQRLPHNVSESRALLAEAGYPEGFEVQLDCPNNRYINDEELCIALSAMWAKVGIKVRVNAMPRALYFPKLEKMDSSLYLLGWGGAITDAEPTLSAVLRNRGVNGVGYSNLGNYVNPKLDALASASGKEPDPAKRELLIKAALREHNEQVHHIPLHRQVIPWAMRSNVDAVHRADNWLEWRWVTVR